MASSKWLRTFRERLDIAIIDEAGAVILLETMIIWKGNTPLILDGDEGEQLDVLPAGRAVENGPRTMGSRWRAFLRKESGYVGGQEAFCYINSC